MQNRKSLERHIDNRADLGFFFNLKLCLCACFCGGRLCNKCVITNVSYLGRNERMSKHNSENGIFSVNF